jgi:hypothetical protein
MTPKDQILRLLEECNDDERREILQHIRRTVPIHPIEGKLNTQAEVILEAIDRASDLTLRGIRGIIAEASFLVTVINKLEDWRNIPLVGDYSYDFLIEDATGQVKIQVKMQRKEKGVPKLTKTGKYVVETQRTRGGRDALTGEATRPYRYGEFDILAVSMHPSTNDWGRFMYTIGNWLLPRRGAPTQLEVLQPVSVTTDEDWTDNLVTSIEWFRSGRTKTIAP